MNISAYLSKQFTPARYARKQATKKSVSDWMAAHSMNGEAPGVKESLTYLFTGIQTGSGKKFKKAVKTLSTMETKGQPHLSLLLAETLYLAGLRFSSEKQKAKQQHFFDEAISVCGGIISSGADEASVKTAKTIIGRIMLHEGKVGDAKKLLEAAGTPTAIFALAQIAAEYGKYSEAIQIYGKMPNSLSNEIKAMCLHNLGLAQIRQSDELWRTTTYLFSSAGIEDLKRRDIAWNLDESSAEKINSMEIGASTDLKLGGHAYVVGKTNAGQLDLYATKTTNGTEITNTAELLKAGFEDGLANMKSAAELSNSREYSDHLGAICEYIANAKRADAVYDTKNIINESVNAQIDAMKVDSAIKVDIWGKPYFVKKDGKGVHLWAVVTIRDHAEKAHQTASDELVALNAKYQLIRAANKPSSYTTDKQCSWSEVVRFFYPPEAYIINTIPAKAN